jgi:hypothetical protein
MDVGIGEVDGDLEIVVGHRGIQDERTLAVDPQIETVEEAGPAHVEAELAVGHRRKVPRRSETKNASSCLRTSLGRSAVKVEARM